MLPELGHFALIIALVMALLQASLPAVGVQMRKPALIAYAKPCARVQFLFIFLAFSALTYAFITNDFSVRYVAENSNIALPLIYRICAVWGGHEGSLLLWVFILSLWTLAVSLLSRQLPDEMLARILSVLGFISVGFLLFLLATSNPFTRLFLDAPIQGRDLNPVLQDPGLVSHPPMLYMGYVGFSVAFAFAIAALWSGQLDAKWARWTRPWTLVAWAFLTLGITLGSWWAYRQLGWGGWWFWDPVENASLLPWLVGTALIHSLVVTDQRNTFKAWTVLLAIFAFSLSLMGTFLVRSGVLNSVHSFASDPKRGVFILLFLAIVLLTSLTLYAWRASKLKAGAAFSLCSRETFLLTNNVLLVVAASCILLGTLYPLVIDALGLGKLSVGAPYFNIVFSALMLPLLALMAIGPLVRWKQSAPIQLFRRLRFVFLICIIAAISLTYLFSNRLPFGVFIGLALALWIILATLQDVLIKVRLQKGLHTLPRNFWGMVFAHIGIAVVVMGIVLSKAYEIERNVRMGPSQTVQLAGYDFQLIREYDAKGPNYDAVVIEMQLRSHGKIISTLYPEKRIYRASGTTMTKAAIDGNLWRDLYVSIGEPLANNEWAIRVYYKPFVRWIWWGGLLIMFGGFIAITDRRYLKGKQS